MRGWLAHAGWLRLAPALTVALFLLPLAAGLLGTMLPGFGFLPELGGRRFSLEPWRALFASPELPGAIVVTLISGMGAALLAFLFAIAIAATLHGTRLYILLRRFLAPLLAMPHAALALGLAFLIAPSGWLMRLMAPLVAAGGNPPVFFLPGDRWGVALMAGLVLKETPFLLLAIAAGIGQLPAGSILSTARLLGYRPATAWLKTILPLLYPQLRLPIYAVLAFSLSVVDMAMILGPGTPPTLAVQLLRWFDAADLGSIFPAAAGAALQLLLVAAAILFWRLGERLVAQLFAGWLVGGGRGHLQRGGRWLGAAAAMLLLAISLIAIVSLIAWSLARDWRFPALLPEVWTFDNWMRPGLDIWRPFLTSLWVALGATAIALLLCFACLENERRHGLHPTARALWLIYLPLLVPQISFLFGTQTLFAWLTIDASAAALIWSHLLFVLPYVFLMLADPWRALDERYIRTGLCLGAGRGRVFFVVMLPMLLRPILIAASVGFSVSIALYLPTLFAGSGRFDSLTVEAVAASAGGDRRIAGVYGFLQAALPLAAFAAALILPAIAFRHRRGLRDLAR